METERSVPSVVFSVSELLAATGSEVELVTSAVLVMVPATAGVSTTMVTVLEVMFTLSSVPMLPGISHIGSLQTQKAAQTR